MEDQRDEGGLGSSLADAALDMILVGGPKGRRKRPAAALVRNAPMGIMLNEHLDGDGEAMFRHACRLGLEGIVSKRRDAPYRSGRSPDWLKVKNPDAPAASRVMEW